MNIVVATGTLSFQQGYGISHSQDEAFKLVQKTFQKVVVGFQSHKYLLIGSALKILAVVQFYLTALSFSINVIVTLLASFF